MKKGLLLIVLAIGFCGMVNAQDTKDTQKALPGYRTSFEANPFWHNWFVSFNVGGNALYAEYYKEVDFTSRITFMPVLSIGKWFNPWWGVRAQGGGGAFHGFRPIGNDMDMLHYHYMYVHADAMVGLINFFAPYKENRKFDIVPFVGIGGMTNSKDQTFTINGGIQLRYALSTRFDINVEASGMILDDDFVKRGGFPNDGIAGLTAGITYRFKNREFKTSPTNEEMAALANANQLLKNQVSQLEQKNKEMEEAARAAKAKAEAALAAKETVQKQAEATNYKSMLVTVPFRFNSAEIAEENDPIVYNVATFMKENPNAKIRIVGYADKFGPVNVNMKISEKRANAVLKLLQSYGANTNNVTVEFVGKDKPFYTKENKWNRCATVEVVK